MRKTSLVSLLAALALAAPAPAHAQFAFSGGINLTDLIGDDAGETSRKSGLNLGASFPILTLGPVQVVAEGFYRQKGAQRNLTDVQQSLVAGQSVDFGIDYVEVPVLARLNLGLRAGRFIPYLAAGPAFAWKIDCGVSGAAGASGELACDDLMGDALGETLRDYERGLVLGGGVDVVVLGGSGAIRLDARYTRGLSRVSGGADVRNRAFSLMLGYALGVPANMMGSGMGGMPTGGM